MDYGNTCALLCRFMLLILLLYGLILSSLTLESCQFLKAVTTQDAEGKSNTYGVGLLNFETETEACLPHSKFIKENYNGMEMAAKVCGYVAPCIATVVVVWLMLDCCCRKKGVWGTKCLPSICIFGACVCQSLTFLIFMSDLFCNNKDVQKCDLGDTGYRSIQACLVYFFSLILYYCGPTPKQFARGKSLIKMPGKASASKSGDSKGEDDDEVVTKEMYAKRRKEKNVKGKGVSGRSKKEIFDDLEATGHKKKKHSNGKSVKKKKSPENLAEETGIVVYDGGALGDSGKFSREDGEQARYDDYVDEPDGMDWSAYSPGEREAYYEQKRKKRQREKERKRGKERERDSRNREQDNGDEYADEYGRQRSSSRGSSRHNDGGYDDYDGSGYGYDKGGGGYDDAYYGRDGRGNDDYERGNSRGGHDDYDGRSYDDYGKRDSRSVYSDYSRGERNDYNRSGRDYDSRGNDYDSRGGNEYYDDQYDDRYYDRDSSGMQLARYDDRSYYDDPPENDDYHRSRSSSSRNRSGSRGRSSDRGKGYDSYDQPYNDSYDQSYNDSYYDQSYAQSYNDYDSRRDDYSRRRDDYYGEEPSIV
mmetsp:Transcript_15109/g.29420  ORF Transcript_15109/g.29420 Transcript_15109/m.29420 type:complete len:589 (+) Transcript_15109:366-2132(+)